MQDLEREKAQEQSCVRNSVLEAIGENVTATGAGLLAVLEARMKMQAAAADLDSALLVVQSKQSAAAEALTYSKGASGHQAAS